MLAPGGGAFVCLRRQLSGALFTSVTGPALLRTKPTMSRYHSAWSPARCTAESAGPRGGGRGGGPSGALMRIFHLVSRIFFLQPPWDVAEIEARGVGRWVRDETRDVCNASGQRLCRTRLTTYAQGGRPFVAARARPQPPARSERAPRAQQRARG